MEPITSKEGEVGVVHSDRGGSTDMEKIMKTTAIEEQVTLMLERDEFGGGIGGILEGGERLCYGDGGGGGGGGGSGLNSPPPFLRKTFEMVDDPQTDELISWSVSGKSFVIWDHLKFSSNLLSKYFKHNNFSSFIYQLNCYGFKKIDSDRWEYANEWFEAEKKHLLKNIKRRTQHSSSVHRKGATRNLPDRGRHKSLEAELEKLRNDHKTLKTEVLNLKRRQESTEHRFAAIDKSLGITDLCKQKETFILMAKAFANPEFLRQFVQCMRMERELSNGGIAKKQRLVAPPRTNSPEEEELKTQTVAAPGSTERSGKAADSNGENNQQLVFTSVDDSGSPLQHEETNGGPGTTDPAMNAEDFILLGKLLEDDLVNENETNDQLAQHQSKIVLELEDLIAKPPDWAAYMKDLRQQSGLS